MPTLTEQVAALEAKLDHMRKKYEDCRADLQVAEAALATARVEGAREFVARYVSYVTSPEISDTFFHYLRDLERFRDREYPAPTERERARTPQYRCWVCRDTKEFVSDSGDKRKCPECRLTPPQAAPEPLRFTVTEWADRLPYITLTPEDCRRIVALGSRPTQTAEG